MKVIYLISGSFITQDMADLYINTVSQSFQVELWSLKKLFGRNYKLSEEVKDYISISSLEELDNKLSELQGPKIIITNLTLTHLEKVYNTIKRHKVEVAHIKKDNIQNFMIASSDLLCTEGGFLKKTKTKIKKINFLNRLIEWKKLGKVRYDYLLSEYNYFPERANSFVKIHHVKYDEFLKNRDKRSLFPKKYVVFLDTNIPFHPDILVHMREKSVDAEYYFEIMNKFFDHVEDRYDLEVIIAAHPKSEYTKETFANREIIKYKTPNLVQNCEFVLTHATTSIMNAILCEKPIIFLYYEEMLRRGTRFWTISTFEYAKRLNAPLVDLEKSLEFDLILDDQAYQKFKYDFLVNREKENIPNEKLITEFLRLYEKNYKKDLKILS